LPPNSIRRRKSFFKGFAASGWQTAATAMRLAVALRSSGPPSLLGLGVDELRWLAPVRPGVLLDRTRGDRTHVIPESQGTVRVKWTVNNQNDEAVLTFIPTVIVPRRQDA
jgi:acyl dehydratase